MPIYEYNCSDCNQDVEVFFLSLTEASEEKPLCPECGGKKLERIISSVSVAKEKTSPAAPGSQKQKTQKEDTKTLADTMNKADRKAKKEYGDDFKEVATRLEKGESSTSIEKSMRARVGEKMETH